MDAARAALDAATLNAALQRVSVEFGGFGRCHARAWCVLRAAGGLFSALYAAEIGG